MTVWEGLAPLVVRLRNVQHRNEGCDASQSLMHKGDKPSRIIAHSWALMSTRKRSRWGWLMLDALAR